MKFKFLSLKSVQYLRDGDTCDKEILASDDSVHDPCKTVGKSEIYVYAPFGYRLEICGRLFRVPISELLSHTLYRWTHVPPGSAATCFSDGVTTRRQTPQRRVSPSECGT